MRILCLANKLPYPPKDGGAIGVLNTALGLAEAGNKVTIFAINTRKHAFDPGKIPLPVTSKISFITVNANTSIKPVRMILNLLFSRKPYIAVRFHKTRIRDVLLSHLREHNYDLVQLEGPYMGYYLPDIKRFSKATVVFRSHNVEYEIWERKARNEANRVKKFYLESLSRRIKKYELKILQYCDLMVTVSDRDERQLRNSGFTKPSITIPSGINVSEYHCQDIPQDHNVCYIGALDWLPNQEGLLWFIEKVFPDVRAELPGTILHIAGRNAPAELESQLQKPGIVYHGEVEDAHIFLEISRILIVPVLSGSGIRIKILEGMALCKAMVSSSIGIEGLHLKHGKHILVADEPGSFGNELISLLKNPEKSKMLGMNARKLVQEKFDTFTLCSRLTQFYKEKA